jgi:Dolichyl-phosphate-mannose-protein mannosyltransferase
MTQGARRFDLKRLSVAIAAVVILLSVLFRLEHLRSAPFNEDEIDGLNVSWEISRGSELYVHIWDARAPLAFYVNSLLLRLTPQDENTVIRIRYLYQLAVGMAFLLLFLAISSFTDTASAMLTCTLMASCSIFVSRTTQVRTDVLMFMFFAAAFYAFIVFRIRARSYWLVIAGAMFALSALCKHVGLFPFAAAATYLLMEIKTAGVAKSEAARNLAILISSFIMAALVAMLIMFGADVAQALNSYFAEPLLVKYSESLRRQELRILPEIIANLPFWLIGIGAWIALHFRCRGKSSDASDQRFILINSYFAISYLVVRGHIFEQDLIIPAFVFAWATGHFHNDIVTWVRSRKGGVATLAVFYFLLGVFPLFFYQWHHNRNLAESVRLNEKAHTEFIQANGINKGEDPGIQRLAELYSGKFGTVDHLPGRRQWQQKLLLKSALEKTSPNDFVLSEDDTPIFRHMTNPTVRAEQLRNLLQLGDARKGAAPRFSGLCRVEPALCEKELNPEMRLMRILEKYPPGLIILGHELAQVLFPYDSVRAWLSVRYRFSFDEETITWMASPVG